ncbi:MAG: cohesin domain-containing protein, partial [Phycisphaerae bacterium]
AITQSRVSLSLFCLDTLFPRLELIPDSTCLQPGETLTVTLRMTDLGVVKASGFQAFLSFDPAVLSFVGGSYTDTPFGFQFPIETVDGSIRLAAGVVPGNQSPSSQDADLATLTFTAAAALCGGAVVGFDRAHQPPTRLSSAGGPEIPGLGLIDTPRVVIDGTAPVLTCPPAVAVSCDASTDPRVNPVVGLAMAGDACGGTPTVSFSDAVNPGVCPRESTIMRTWTAADDCLNSAMCFQIITVVDESVPLITCPEDLAVDADAGTCGALLDPGSAAAVDACDNNPTLFAKRSDGLLLSDPFPVGTTAVTWRATDDCGNIAECTQQIVVNPFSELIVDVAFAPAVSTPLSRCITFEFRDCAVPVPVVVEQEVTFVNGLATDVVVRVPCGSYTCLSARDRLHTLTRTDVDDFGILQGRFVADFTDRAAAPGDDDSLVGGNFNDDSFIDMLDFEIFSEQWASDYGTGDTSCLVGGPHADASGNGVVLTEDFTFVQVNFLQGSDVACCGGDSASRPVREVSEAELRRRGLEQLTVGDLDGNGVLDAADVALFMRGVRPRAQAGEIRRPATRKSRR